MFTKDIANVIRAAIDVAPRHAAPVRNECRRPQLGLFEEEVADFFAGLVAHRQRRGLRGSSDRQDGKNCEAGKEVPEGSSGADRRRV